MRPINILYRAGYSDTCIVLPDNPVSNQKNKHIRFIPSQYSINMSAITDISIAISNVRAVDVYQRAGQGDLDSNDLENWLRYYLPYGQTAYCACAFLSF